MFNTKIPLYGVFILVAIVLGSIIIYKNTEKFDFNKDEKTALLLYVLLGSIFGAKYITYFANIQNYNEPFNFIKSGVSSYGAVIGIILIMVLYSKQYGKKFKDLIYIIISSIPLMYGIGKIGCFFAGCCYGIKYNGPLNVVYNYSNSAPNGISLFPIQLLESVAFIGIFIYVYIKTKNKRSSDTMIGKVIIMYGVTKFLLDYLRMSHVGIIITINQIISIDFVFIGIYLILKNKCNYFKCCT